VISSTPRPIYRGRLAPSPTGGLHLGIARTALCAWLRARQSGGVLVMRVEDIDSPRVVAGSAESIMHDLRWLGIDWDEGPDLGGPHAPYLQSQRAEHYARAIAQLEARDRVYPCTCSRKEIAGLASAPHGDLGPLYPGTCRDAAPARTDRPPALRFKHEGAAPSFRDVLQGPYTEPVIDDFVLRRGDGMVSYQLAVVVDDIAMGISEVVRGDDLMSSTPRQLALYAALGELAPSFLHVPLLLDLDGRRLSKRHGAPSIAEYRSAGIGAERIVGMLAATLGLAADGESLTPAELLPRFVLERLPLTAARVDSRISTWQKAR
jgi:glutamyl-tRNA synthetase